MTAESTATPPPSATPPAPTGINFSDDFAGSELDPARWLPEYLPHWSTPAAAAARYTVGDGQLRLLITADQSPWCPALDGDLRVSSLQTANLAGPVGSTIGAHQFDPPATVRTGPDDRRRYTPQGGQFPIRLQASADPRLMVAFWMIGLGDDPAHSAEICVVEIFGRNVTPTSAKIGVGVHPHFDPAVTDDFTQVPLSIDVTAFHEYAATWTAEAITFFVDGEPVKTVHQTIAYPMLLLLGVYEFPAAPTAPPDPFPYPKSVAIDWVRCSPLQ